jgi:hypothetical protein
VSNPRLKVKRVESRKKTQERRGGGFGVVAVVVIN